MLTRRPELLPAAARVLHVGPEASLEPLLRVPGGAYDSIDIDYPPAMHRMDVSRMTFADASFDLCVCLHVLDVVTEEERAVAELHRVTRPGGTAIVAVPHELDENRPDYPRALARPGFEVESVRCSATFDEAEIALHGLLASETLHLCRRPQAKP